jgi:hypothetical protein
MGAYQGAPKPKCESRFAVLSHPGRVASERHELHAGRRRLQIRTVFVFADRPRGLGLCFDGII